jgi:RNA polymerase sigma-70 factor (ECF subfamily)
VSEQAVEQRGATLVEAAMAGDRVALRELWSQHRRWVAAVVMAHKPREAEVDDLLQDVAIAMLAKISTLQDPGAFPGWLRTVAVNAARLAGRKRAAGPRIRSMEPETLDTREARGEQGGWGGLGGSGHVGGTAGEGVVSEEARRLLALAMELPEDYREPLLLRTVQDLSYAQISAITGLPETTIETRIARGRRMLRELAERVRAGPAARGVPAVAAR